MCANCWPLVSKSFLKLTYQIKADYPSSPLEGTVIFGDPTEKGRIVDDLIRQFGKLLLAVKYERVEVYHEFDTYIELTKENKYSHAE